MVYYRILVDNIDPVAFLQGVQKGTGTGGLGYPRRQIVIKQQNNGPHGLKYQKCVLSPVLELHVRLTGHPNIYKTTHKKLAQD